MGESKQGGDGDGDGDVNSDVNSDGDVNGDTNVCWPPHVGGEQGNEGDAGLEWGLGGREGGKRERERERETAGNSPLDVFQRVVFELMQGRCVLAWLVARHETRRMEDHRKGGL